MEAMREVGRAGAPLAAAGAPGLDPATGDPAGAIAFAVALPLALVALAWLWRAWRRGAPAA
jgi:hypothetical protein